jgi:hypothetical protein
MENHHETYTIKKREDPPIKRQQTDITQFKTFNTINRGYYRHQDYNKLQRTTL